MEVSFFIQGWLLGFSIAAPVGPIGVLCIRRTLSAGLTAGLCAGLGAACADSVYGSIAAFGLSALSGVLLAFQHELRLVGGLFLLYLGGRTFLAPPSALESAAAPLAGRLADFGSTLLLTLANPMTILSFAAIFAGLGIGSRPGDYGAATFTVGGVFCGSLLWWCILAATVSQFRSRFSPGNFRLMQRVSGCMLVSFGLVSLFAK